ncbi:MAG: alpha/beta hydrolase, partial [Formivibrio sp.]|nr:alpha/beta hydrolase [Formivibrio sp.]
MKTEHYGPHEDQVGDLYLPGNAKPAVICLLHGGFWRMPYGRDQMDAIACDWVLRGFAVWNLGYRRLGIPDGGWPLTGEDVIRGIDYLSSLAAKGTDLDLERIAVVGHSAGGH